MLLLFVASFLLLEEDEELDEEEEDDETEARFFLCETGPGFEDDSFRELADGWGDELFRAFVWWKELTFSPNTFEEGERLSSGPLVDG